MISRREMISTMAGSLFLTGASLARPHEVSTQDAEAQPLLAALPAKKPLIKRSYRPPNFETPLADLRRPFTANDAFFVRYHLALIPEVDPRTWRLRAAGTAAKEWSLDELKRSFEQVSLAAVAQCAGNRRRQFAPRVPGVQWGSGAMGHAIWTGVRLRDVLNDVGVSASALEVTFDGADRALLPGTPDFVKSLPIERALEESTLIAFEMNGAPLPHWNGAPARLIVPGWTATYWVKHLVEIRIEAQPFEGFWMQRAYRLPKEAFSGALFASQATSDTVPITEMLVNSVVTSHVSGERIAAGRAAQLRGWAWDSGTGIATVELSFDGGQTWRAASLDPDLGPFAWRGFRFPLDTSRPGLIVVAVRATSRAGARQPEKLTPNPSGYHDNVIQALHLEVV